MLKDFGGDVETRPRKKDQPDIQTEACTNITIITIVIVVIGTSHSLTLSHQLQIQQLRWPISGQEFATEFVICISTKRESNEYGCSKPNNGQTVIDSRQKKFSYRVASTANIFTIQINKSRITNNSVN